jgi:hypothetical protein
MPRIRATFLTLNLSRVFLATQHYPCAGAELPAEGSRAGRRQPPPCPGRGVQAVLGPDRDFRDHTGMGWIVDTTLPSSNTILHLVATYKGGKACCGPSGGVGRPADL